MVQCVHCSCAIQRAVWWGRCVGRLGHPGGQRSTSPLSLSESQANLRAWSTICTKSWQLRAPVSVPRQAAAWGTPRVRPQRVHAFLHSSGMCGKHSLCCVPSLVSGASAPGLAPGGYHVVCTGCSDAPVPGVSGTTLGPAVLGGAGVLPASGPVPGSFWAAGPVERSPGGTAHATGGQAGRVSMQWEGAGMVPGAAEERSGWGRWEPSRASGGPCSPPA